MSIQTIHILPLAWPGTLSIVLSVLAVLLALGIGLFLRRLLITRLRKTVLDEWLVQTFGGLVVILVLAVATPAVFSIWDVNNLLQFWNTLWSGRPPTLKDILDPAKNLVLSLLILLLGIGVGRTLKTLAIRNLEQHRVDINTRTLLGRITYFLILVLAAFWILSLWSISIGVPLAYIGTITVAFTFAIQDILKDLVAGIYILVERPFRIGDEISMETFTGRVEDVSIRATRLRLITGEEITIPNTRVFNSNVVNNTFYGERRVTLALTLPYEDYKKDETPEEIAGLLKDLEWVLPKPEPTALLSGFVGAQPAGTPLNTDKQVLLTLRFWIENGKYETVSDVLHALHSALPRADIAVKESAGAV